MFLKNGGSFLSNKGGGSGHRPKLRQACTGSASTGSGVRRSSRLADGDPRGAGRRNGRAAPAQAGAMGGGAG